MKLYISVFKSFLKKLIPPKKTYLKFPYGVKDIYLYVRLQLDRVQIKMV